MRDLFNVTKKEICLDMDGTIVDLYNTPNWLYDLNREKVYPYQIAKPKVNMDELIAVLKLAKKRGFTIKVITWLPKGKPSKDYCQKVEKAKINWLKRYKLLSLMDKVFVLPYGTPKDLYGKGLIVDDSNEVANRWLDVLVDANDANWVEVLRRKIN